MSQSKAEKITKQRASLKRKGKGRYWRLVVTHRTQGKRAARELNRGGETKEEKDKVKDWLAREQALGHQPEAADLLDQFQLELEDLVHRLEQEEPQWKALSDADLKERSVEISEKQEHLKAARGILAKGLLTKQGRSYHQQILLLWTEMVKRKPDLVFPMTEAREFFKTEQKRVQTRKIQSHLNKPTLLRRATGQGPRGPDLRYQGPRPQSIGIILMIGIQIGIILKDCDMDTDRIGIQIGIIIKD